jgi:hypothetical protein
MVSQIGQVAKFGCCNVCLNGVFLPSTCWFVCWHFVPSRRIAWYLRYNMLERKKSCSCHGITNWSSTEIWVLLCVFELCTFTVDMSVCMLALCTESQDSWVPLVQHVEKQKACICHDITNWPSTEILGVAIRAPMYTVDMFCMLALCTESHDSLVPSVQQFEMQMSCTCHGITNWSSTEIWMLLCVLQW